MLRKRRRLKAMAAALNGVPSWNSTSVRRGIVTVRPASLRKGADAASLGSSEPSRLRRYSGSPRALISCMALRVLAWAGSRELIRPAEATVMRLVGGGA